MIFLLLLRDVVYNFSFTAFLNHTLAPTLKPLPSIKIIMSFSGIASIAFKYR